MSQKEESLEDFALGGRRIPWWAVLFSIVATETSALTVISMPGLAYVGNLGFLQIAAFGAGSILGMARREIEQKFDEIVAFSEVEKFLDTPVKSMRRGGTLAPESD